MSQPLGAVNAACQDARPAAKPGGSCIFTIANFSGVLMNWYFNVMRNYLNVDGRARRTEYWMFMLIYIGMLVVASLLDNLMGTSILGGLVALVHLIPSITVGVRRLHDINRNGWWLLVSLVPLIGWIIAIYFAVKEGDAGSNTYGANPKDLTLPA